MALQLVRPKQRSFASPSLIHLFSTSSNSGDGSDGDNNHSSLSSYLSGVRARLRNQQQRERPASSISNSSVPHSKPNSSSASLEEIQKNLSEFRRRSAVSPPVEASPTPSQSQPHFSFQESYIKNVSEQRERMSFDTIKESLQKLGPNSGTNLGNKRTGQFLSLTDFKHTLKFNPSDGNAASLAFGELPKSTKGKTREREAAAKTEFVKIYSHSELGEKLKQLRPERKEGEQWFSLEELNERLVKLREMEQKEAESRSGFPFLKELRESLTSMNDTEKQKTSSQRVDTLDFMGRTPKFMLYPPKENLVEQYFHPDNMSSAEKMKIELSKVRDEFKMSESDCGSARVQVAQLTTKIKHLSSVLHKKDKHSRKGLIAMVQKRKKLLKYLRRTDWDSYCFVLSKLGLRDTPDYKVRDYAATTGQEKNNKKKSGKQKKKGKNLQTQSA